MTCLWIDLWDKKVWIALEVEWISIPKDIIQRTKIIPYIKEIIKNYNISHIIVGLPYDLYGVKMKQLEKTQKFIEKIKEIFLEQKVIWYDERFTSFEARDEDNKGENIDDISASLILESYLREKIWLRK